jgi:hypothetical protein
VRSDTALGPQKVPVVFVLLYRLDINESKFAPIRELPEPGLHIAVPGHEETSAIRISFEAKEDIDRDLICSGPNKMRTADVPWTHMDGPHMNGLRWRASSDKNVIFLGGAIRELRVETASQEFVPD